MDGAGATTCRHSMTRRKGYDINKVFIITTGKGNADLGRLGQVARKLGLGLGLKTGNQELRLGLETGNRGLRIELAMENNRETA